MTCLHSSRDGRAAADVMADVAPAKLSLRHLTFDLRHPGAPSCGRNVNTAGEGQGQRVPLADVTTEAKVRAQAGALADRVLSKVSA
jgi:hypothetical protein